MYNIAICKNRKDKIYNNIELTLEELVEKLKNTHRTKETFAHYNKMPKEQRDNIKDVGGFVGGYLTEGKRTKETIAYRQILTLDVDNGYLGLIDYLSFVFEHNAIIYTTHNHAEEKERFRIVIPLDKKVNPTKYQALANAIMKDLGADYFDKTSNEASRMMYFPSTSSDGEYRFLHLDNPILKVDEVLQSINYQEELTAPPLNTQQNPLEKEGIIGAFANAYSIHEAIDKYLTHIYEPTVDNNRYTYKHGSTQGGLIIYDNIFAYSHHSTDPINSRLCNAFDLVKNHLFKDSDENKNFENMVKLISKDHKVIKELGKQKLKLAQQEFTSYLSPDTDTVNQTSIYKEGNNNDLSQNTPKTIENTEEEDKLWITKLKVNDKGRYLNTINNLVIILENDSNLKNKIALNEFSHNITIKQDLPWRNIEGKDIWTDNDDSSLRHYIEKIYNIKSREALFDAISVVSSKLSYHPIKDYLNSLSWDGKNRIETLFIDYLGAEDDRYTKDVARKILTAAVARIFEPGIKFDYMPVFVGKEGIGKSHLINLLGKEWYSDSINTVQGKEAYEQLQEAWIVEMAELSAVKKAETEAVKHFISKREDIYRVAYGRRVEKFKRQCVFFGTTNEENFLKDKNGNRRFWPIKVNQKNIKKSVFQDLTPQEVNHIWAEAVHLYNCKEKLILEGESAKSALQKQEKHLDEDPRAGLIYEYLEKPIPKSWSKMGIDARKNYLAGGDLHHFSEEKVLRQKVCAMEIWREVLHEEVKALTPFKAREITDILRKAPGWTINEGRLRFGSYGLQTAFIREKKEK